MRVGTGLGPKIVTDMGAFAAVRRMLIKRIGCLWEISHGSVPDDMIVMHKCDNPSCSNPEHLMLGTMKDNTQDMLRKGRGRWGDKSQMA
ncbi:HNH endonuclease signature motif containing protein [Sphingomonas sp. MMS24-JH45]